MSYIPNVAPHFDLVSFQGNICSIVGLGPGRPTKNKAPCSYLTCNHFSKKIHLYANCSIFRFHTLSCARARFRFQRKEASWSFKSSLAGRRYRQTEARMYRIKFWFRPPVINLCCWVRWVEIYPTIATIYPLPAFQQEWPHVCFYHFNFLVNCGLPWVTRKFRILCSYRSFPMLWHHHCTCERLWTDLRSWRSSKFLNSRFLI